MKFARRHLGKILVGSPLLIASYLRAQEAAAVGPGVVHLAARRYDEDLVVDTGVTFAGEGPGATSVRSIKSAGFDGLWDTDSPSGPQNIAIRHLRVEGSRGNGVNLYAPGVVIEEVVSNNNAGHGFFLRWSTNLGERAPRDMMESRLVGLEAHDNGGAGIICDGAHDSQGEGWVAFMNGDIGILIGPRGGPLQLVNGGSWGRTQRWAWWIEGANTSLTNCKGESERDGCFAIMAHGVHGSVRAYGITSKPTTGLHVGRGVLGTDLRAQIENCAKPVVLDGAGPTTIHGTILHQFPLSGRNRRPVIVGTAFGADIRLSDKERGYIHTRAASTSKA